MQCHQSTPVRVVHSEAIIAAGVVALLKAEGDLSVETCSLEWAAQAYSASDDVPLPVLVTDHAGVLSLAQSAHGRKDARILVLSSLDREHDVRLALEAGARGYLFQGCEVAQLVDAVHAVAAGAKYLPARIASQLADSLMRHALTARETEVLSAMCTGASNKQISLQLGVSPATVKAFVRLIYDKIGASARTQAIAIAAERGLLARRSQDDRSTRAPRRTLRRLPVSNDIDPREA